MADQQISSYAALKIVLKAALASDNPEVAAAAEIVAKPRYFISKKGTPMLSFTVAPDRDIRCAAMGAGWQPLSNSYGKLFWAEKGDEDAIRAAEALTA